MDIPEILGKTFTSIVMEKDEEILFTSKTGERYLMSHDQDCCEHVRIEDIEGDLQDLVGEPILQAEEVTSQDPYKGKPEDPDSFTWTFYKLATINGYVTIRWLGESNGYYSEGVDFEEIK